MQQQQTAAQKLNSVGKYIYKHIDGAYKIAFGPQTCDVYITMYYQPKEEYYQYRTSDMYEMKFDISLATYQNKIRINVTEMTDMERTIGQNIYKPEQLQDMNAAYPMIYDNICKHIEKAYEDFEFVF